MSRKIEPIHAGRRTSTRVVRLVRALIRPDERRTSPQPCSV